MKRQQKQRQQRRRRRRERPSRTRRRQRRQRQRKRTGGQLAQSALVGSILSGLTQVISSLGGVVKQTANAAGQTVTGRDAGDDGVTGVKSMASKVAGWFKGSTTGREKDESAEPKEPSRLSSFGPVGQAALAARGVVRGGAKVVGGAMAAGAGGMAIATGAFHMLKGAVDSVTGAFTRITSTVGHFVEAFNPATMARSSDDMTAVIGMALQPILEVATGIVRDFSSVCP